MKCENNLCVYWKDEECILREISIDNTGICTECIYVNIDGQILKNARKKFLREEQ